MLQLQCFMAMVSEGTQTKAANTLNISQSTLSKSISSLEAELKFKLFNRIGRELLLNEQGNLFYKYASDSIKIINNGIDVMQSLKGEVLGTVKISTLAYNGILSDCIRSYHDESPHINFVFTQLEDTGDTLISIPDSLTAYDSDLLLTARIVGANFEPYSGNFFVKKKIAEDEYCIVISPKYAGLPVGQSTINIKDIYKHTCIIMDNALTPKSLPFNLWNSILALQPDSTVRIITVSDIAHKISLLSTGIGIAFLPSVCLPFAKKCDPSLRIFRVEGISLKRHILLARRRKIDLSSQAIDFWNYALRYFGLPDDKED